MDKDPFGKIRKHFMKDELKEQGGIITITRWLPDTTTGKLKKMTETFKKNEKRGQRPDPVLVIKKNVIFLYDNFKRHDDGKLTYKKKTFKIKKGKNFKKGYPRHYLYIKNFIYRVTREGGVLKYKASVNTGAREAYAIDPYKPKKRHPNYDGKDYSKIVRNPWAVANKVWRYANYKITIREKEKYDSKFSLSVWNNFRYLGKGKGFYQIKRYGAESGMKTKTYYGGCPSLRCIQPPSSLVTSD